ncbi:MAG: hypothetical protein CMP11_03905 [Zetaproteobacteria bacterium]|nr:hypothetical protein [Pseudobdellovibrionaceae bacterium]|tara:strand:- start:893 stop:1666 length:774 start_codon:yes stop_codon:yes gene_type:complete
MKFIFFFTLVLLNFISCGEEEERPEQLDRLRVIGVKTNPPVIIFDDLSSITDFELEALVSVPKDDEIIDQINFVDDSFLFTQTIDIVWNEPVFLEEFSNLNLYLIKGKIDLDSLQDNQQYPDLNNDKLEEISSYIFRYGLEVKTQNDNEIVVGNFIVSLTENEYQNQSFNIDITNPIDESDYNKEEEIEIKMNLEKSVEEEVKVIWFTSEGKIENPRSKETLLTTGTGEGKHLVLVGTYGKFGYLFNYDFVSINVLP